MLHLIWPHTDGNVLTYVEMFWHMLHLIWPHTDGNVLTYVAMFWHIASYMTTHRWPYSDLFQNLTGGPNGGRFVTDVSNASRTMLMNIHTLQWDPELCKSVIVNPMVEIHSFIHSGYFYSASSTTTQRHSAAPDYSTDTVSKFHNEAPQAISSEGLAQGPYVAARVGFEPVTLRTKGIESANEPPCPTNRNLHRLHL